MRRCPTCGPMNRVLPLVAGCMLLTGSAPITVPRAPHVEHGAARQRDVLQWGYDEWVTLSPSEQAAYLSGLLAGAAVVEAEGLVPSDSLDVSVTKLRQERRLTFGLRPNVYQVRMAEYYFWENHRGQRIAEAFSAVHNALSNR